MRTINLRDFYGVRETNVFFAVSNNEWGVFFELNERKGWYDGYKREQVFRVIAVLRN